MSKVLFRSSIFLSTCILCFAFSSDLQRKVIRDADFDVECYVTHKSPKLFYPDKIYFWYRSGEIHQSVSSAGGDVLHDNYVKYYRSNQLAEKGVFHYGLKTGNWKHWYENGQLRLQEAWRNGFKHGEAIAFNYDGSISQKGSYWNNLKEGRWVNYNTKDTVYYVKNEMFEERPMGFFERKLRKKDSLEKVQIRIDRNLERKKDSLERVRKKKNRYIIKQNDSIKRIKKKLNRKQEKQRDSLERLNKKKAIQPKEQKNTNSGFFGKLFKKKKTD
ncbi:toxin-antitoxin system YwqK family antitoxin [Snuella sedimenti]|uniref:MORN repeat protein n=1 Tax=Snuella sedimenti TaxID=2798802 RepID=A0A8J7LYS4_9FLAO|nr:hypothetical protein [Snuella sedimenti]MBJ6368906.1 hypothetical protein [Snuella sedimenti]